MLDPIHPFPAKMAPEIAFEFLKDLPTNSIVLDPMCGSGVAMRSALENGHVAVGRDADPLAVLMTRVSTENAQHSRLMCYAEDIVKKAKSRERISVPWHDEEETKPFVEFWFARRQRDALARLALSLDQSQKVPEYALRAMKIALSRLIITKTKGASLAWDVSHSRPHKKKDDNDFEVLTEFLKACEFLSKKLQGNKADWTSTIKKGDARKLSLPDNSIDAVITSPPYMNAIDYMRGHRLALVWLGYSLSDLRIVRSQSIGSEVTRQTQASRAASRKKLPDAKTQRLMDHYIHDLGRLAREIKRVAKPKASVCIITANSNLRGYEVPT